MNCHVKYGRNRRLKTLGRYPDKKLADARQEAKRYLAVHNPKFVSHAYRDATESFLEDAERRNRPKTVSGYRRYLGAFETGKNVADISK